MQKFILTRAFYSIITIWLLVTIIFGAVRLTGDPSKMMEDAGVDADYEQRIKARWGLDDPIHVQYVKYIGNLLKGDFGTSFHDNLPVTDIYFGRLPNSLKLGLAAFIISIALGVPLGMLSAMKVNTPWGQYGQGVRHTRTVSAQFLRWPDPDPRVFGVVRMASAHRSRG